MAKKKPQQIIRECKECINSFSSNNRLYCKLRLQDINKLKDSGTVEKVEDCIFYKVYI